MSNPEVEVRSFKQQGGEILKDAWYHINNAHHRCTKNHSTTILLRNFYVGISSWICPENLFDESSVPKRDRKGVSKTQLNIFSFIVEEIFAADPSTSSIDIT
jgi:hypothetical protein